jgi:hypothetical protein
VTIMQATQYLKRILLAAALFGAGCSSGGGASSGSQATIAMDCVAEETECAEACLESAGADGADLDACMAELDDCVAASDPSCDEELEACVGAGELADCLDACDVTLDDCAPDQADDDIGACLEQGGECLEACDVSACEIELPACVENLLADAEACFEGDDPFDCLVGLFDGDCELPEIDTTCFTGAGECVQACGEDVADCLGQ